MNLQEMSTKDLLVLHNQIADKAAGPKTFSTRAKLIERLKSITAAKNINLASFGQSTEPEVTEPSTESEVVEFEVFELPKTEAPRKNIGLGTLAKAERKAKAKEAAARIAAADKAKARLAARAEKAPKAKGRGIGALAKELLLHPAGFPHDDIAKTINLRIDGAHATEKSVRWYACDMRKKGIELPERQRKRPPVAEPPRTHHAGVIAEWEVDSWLASVKVVKEAE